MPLLLSLLGNKWIWIGLIIGGLSLAVKVQTSRLDSAKAETVTVQASFNVFKEEVRQTGEAAQKAAKAHEEADIQRAKESDDANKAALRSLDSQYAQYRMRITAGNDATSRIVPQASGSPGDNKICLDRESANREITAILERAEGRLAALVQPYDQAATVTLKTCKDWALGLR